MPTTTTSSQRAAGTSQGDAAAVLWVRKIQTADVYAALRLGIQDFRSVPTHSVLFGLFYALAGLLLVAAISGRGLAPLVFPLVAGFALVGPFAASGFYELSRRREAGMETRWWHLFGGFTGPNKGSLLALGLVLVALLVLWLASAALLTRTAFGFTPTSIGQFVDLLFTTSAGWMVIVAGNVIGAIFALFAFAISAISFPLLIDRDTDMISAADASVRAVGTNPGPMALWALIVVGLLILGALPALLGLAVVFPILGHATWHLYRRLIVH